MNFLTTTRSQTASRVQVWTVVKFGLLLIAVGEYYISSHSQC